jgi:hypothetical protein
MNGIERQQFFKQALLVAWGMFTLVLIFSIVFLVAQMISQGKSPLDVAILEEGGLPPREPPPGSAVGTIDATLYFASSDGRLLVPETRHVEYTGSTVENCRNVLAALIDGPRDILHPIVSRSAKVRGVYLLAGGELVVDFSHEVELDHPRSASAEALLVYGVVNSLTQEKIAGPQDVPVKKVRFLFAGSPPTESFPAHIDLSESIAPDPQWIAPSIGGTG